MCTDRILTRQFSIERAKYDDLRGRYLSLVIVITTNVIEKKISGMLPCQDENLRAKHTKHNNSRVYSIYIYMIKG